MSVSHADTDPLARLGREYARLVRPLVRAISPVAASRGDRAVMDALDAAELLCDTVWTSIQQVLDLSATDVHAGDPHTRASLDHALEVIPRVVDQLRIARGQERAS